MIEDEGEMKMELSILTHPDFGEVRTMVDEDGKILFCASDVASALGYSNPNKAFRDHCRAITKRSSPISGKMMEINFIYEPDVYRLITKSKLPIAVTFEKWVYEVVLPTLRNNGFYAKKELMNDPDFFIQLGLKLKREQEEKLGLQKEVQQLTEVIAEYEPKITYLEQILNSENTMNVTQIAADYGISAIRLNRILHNERIQYKRGKQWTLYVEYMNRGLTQTETKPINGGTMSVTHMKWTQQGRLLIHEVLKKLGILPESEK